MHPFWRLVRFVVMVFVSGFVISASALPALSQAGVPVPEDSALYKAFNQLKTQSSYRVIMNMQSNDPRMAQMAASGMGFGTTEKLVQGNTTQVIMHMKMPATDVRGEIDDWEFRAVVKDGRGARLISSAAVPRLLKRTDQMVDMQLAMLEKQSSVAMLHALAEGPLGMVSAAVNGAQMAQGIGALMAAKKQAHDMFSWKCEGNVGQSGSKTAAQLTDLRATGDQAIEGTAATAYEFYVKENGKSQGPIRLLVGKDSGLPLRIEMNDPAGHGSMRMDYTDFNKPAQIEVPDCLAAAK